MPFKAIIFFKEFCSCTLSPVIKSVLPTLSKNNVSPLNKISSNIIVEDVPNLSARLDQLTPLSKKVHVMLNTSNEEYNNTVEIVSELTLTIGKTVKRVDII